MPKKRFIPSFFSRFVISYVWLLYPALLLILMGIRFPEEKLLHGLTFAFTLFALDVVVLLTVRYRAVIALVVLLILAGCAGAVYTLRWRGDHRYISEVQSITAYRYADNPDYVRFEIRGRIRNWYYDGGVYENVVMTGYEPGGERMYFRMASESEPLTISRRGTAFTIRLDVDVSSRNTDLTVEEYIFQLRYHLDPTKAHECALRMRDFRRVRIRWEEPCMVDDCLLAA